MVYGAIESRGFLQGPLVYSIDEFHVGNHVRKPMEPSQSAPSRLRAHGKLIHQAQPAFRAHAVPGLLGAKANGRERRLDRIGRAQMLPMLGRKVVERQQLVAILEQALDRLGIFRVIGRDEPIEDLQRMLASARLPNLVQHRLRVGFFC